jgi:hypothetical protein
VQLAQSVLEGGTRRRVKKVEREHIDAERRGQALELQQRARERDAADLGRRDVGHRAVELRARVQPPALPRRRAACPAAALDRLHAADRLHL